MGIFSPDYSTPGPGVPKNAPKRKGLARFYEIYFRKFWNLIKLNLLYMITLIPSFVITMLIVSFSANILGINMSLIQHISGSVLGSADAAGFAILIYAVITMLFMVFWGGGPATAGFVYILRSYVWEEPVFMISDFFGHIRSNFRQALTVWIIDLVMLVVICLAYRFYSTRTDITSCLKYVIIVLAAFYTMLHLYIYHLLVTYKLPITLLYKNSALFALSALPFSVITIPVTAFMMLIWPAIAVSSANNVIMAIFSLITVVFLITMVYSAPGLYIEVNACTQIKKYIKEDADVERNG